MYQRSIIGILSLLIIWIASFGSQFPVVDNEMVQTAVVDRQVADDEKQTNPEESLKIVAYEAVLPLIHANVATVACFFIKFHIALDPVIEGESDIVVPHISYFNTLFRLIISPNAP